MEENEETRKKLRGINAKNLILNKDRTPEELREITRRGGIASGIAKRRVKTIREQLKIAMEMIIKGEDGKEHSVRELAVESVLKRILKHGKANELESVAKLLGEYNDKVDLSAMINVLPPVKVDDKKVDFDV